MYTSSRTVANNDWDLWIKPRGISIINILCIGGGGGGGAGFQAAAAAARGGGGGGSSGGVSSLTLPANLCPDTLWILPGKGGIGSITGAGDQTSGDISRVAITPTSTLIAQDTLLISSNNVATFGGTGTGAAAGAGGTSAAVATIANCNLAGLGIFKHYNE
jgi:hypothetical protein